MADAADFYKATHTERVRIIVGGNDRETEFLIPQHIFARASWIPEDFIAGTAEPIRLPDVSPTVFTYYHYYIYYYDVAFPQNPEFDTERPEVQILRERRVAELFETWLFGDKYNIPGLQNCAMDELCNILASRKPGAEECLTMSTMRNCYENTVPGSKLRNVVADYLVCVLEENRHDTSKTDMLNTLSEYYGFVKDIYEAQQSWFKIKVEEKFWRTEAPRYRKPYKYASRYEVDVDDSEK